MPNFYLKGVLPDRLRNKPQQKLRRNTVVIITIVIITTVNFTIVFIAIVFFLSGFITFSQWSEIKPLPLTDTLARRSGGDSQRKADRSRSTTSQPKSRRENHSYRNSCKRLARKPRVTANWWIVLSGGASNMLLEYAVATALKLPKCWASTEEACMRRWTDSGLTFRQKYQISLEASRAELFSIFPSP